MADMEFVWVVRREDLFGDTDPQGYLRLEEPELRERFLVPMLERGFYVERREAERSPEWKQVIPYCLVRHGGRYLLLERLRAQSEARLHGLLHLGVGGHIEPCDQVPQLDRIEAAARRELAEELVLEEIVALRPLGLLNDDGNEVGAVHVGVVYGVELAGAAPGVRETHMMAGSLTPLEDLMGLCQDLRRFESWTAEILCVPGWERWS
ncbi:MAG: NUDIX domain-containing protein [Planctomycetota bacterium]